MPVITTRMLMPRPKKMIVREKSMDESSRLS
jgi:hypothetical protein